MVYLRQKRHVLNCFIFIDYDSLRYAWKEKKNEKKPAE